jgi:acyl-CoA synthetase (AMP-forming)/AMP-acid ligase II
VTETLPGFFAAACAAHADRVALRFEGRAITYRELSRDVIGFARGLAAAGVVKGARVAIYVANRPEWIVSAFAVALLGGVVVAIPTFCKPAERDHLLRRSDACWLIAQPSLRGRDLLAGLPELGRVFVWGRDALPPNAPESAVRAAAETVAPDDDAILLFTSGTTAEPKAVLHRQRAPVLQSLHFARSMELSPDDRMFTAQPFFWAAGIAVSLGATLAAGGSLILQETFDAADALELIERERATVLRAWPHQEKAMAEHPSAHDRDLTSLRKLNFTSPLAPLAGLARDEWGTQGGYGTTVKVSLVP